MKALKHLLLSLIAVISLTTLTAASPRIEKSSYHAMQLKQKINREFDKIDVNSITSKDGFVRISFVISDSGSISITQCNYSDEQLRDKVLEIFNAIQVGDNSDLAGKEFNYNIKFRVGDGH